MTAQDTDTVARTAWGEMRGEGQQGMQAVVNVIYNRVAKQIWWGLTPIEVCKKPYQFSCWLSDDPNCVKCQNVTTDDPQFTIAMNLATQADAGTLDDITDGACNYFSGDAVPKWALNQTPCLTIGVTKFYNTINN